MGDQLGIPGAVGIKKRKKRINDLMFAEGIVEGCYLVNIQQKIAKQGKVRRKRTRRSSRPRTLKRSRQRVPSGFALARDPKKTLGRQGRSCGVNLLSVFS